jgi:SNF2-related domain
LKITPYRSKRVPRINQAKGLAAIQGRKAFAMLMAMRTGKTKVIVDDWGEMVANDQMRDLVIVAPGGVYKTWEAEIIKDLPDDLIKDVRFYTWMSGKQKTKYGKALLDAFIEYVGPRILIMNMEAISAVEDARRLCLKFLRQNQGHNMIVVDESVIIKNQASKAAKFMVRSAAPLAAFRRILSGLVAPHSPLDVYSQFKFLDPTILGFSTFAAFRARYAKVKRVCTQPNTVIRERFLGCCGIKNGQCKFSDDLLREKIQIVYDRDPIGEKRKDMINDLIIAAEGFKREVLVDKIFELGGYIQSYPMIDSYMNLEELKDKIAKHSFRVRLEDCYDMPPSSYSFRDVAMTPEQKRIYHELREFATAQLNEVDHVTATQVIVQMLRLHQVLCGHTRDEKGGWHSIPEKRTESLIELLSDYDGKAVIWCSYDADVRKVAEALTTEFGAGSVARFWGGNTNTREEEEVTFKTNATTRFMVATPDAGGRARTWDVADLVVYYSSRNNLDHRAQSEERPKNEGKMRPIAYVDMRVPGTVEDKIVGALREKIDLATAITGENWKSWLI